MAPLDTLPGRVIGAKPAAVCQWIFTLLGTGPGDSLDDLCPGSGALCFRWKLPSDCPHRAGDQATFKKLTNRELEVRARPVLLDDGNPSMIIEPTVTG